VEGLKNTPADQQPLMGMVFYGFRIMYCTAMLMFGVGISSLWLRWRGKLFTSPWFLRTLVVMTPSGLVATLAGWYLAETGRQPWVIFGILKTIDAISPVPAQALLSTLIAFVCIYSVFMAAFLYFALRLIHRGPRDDSTEANSSGSLKNALRPNILERALNDPVPGRR
jgi:cytochrome d ubiquinol oxidase subunit I